ncbi:MAG: hypothetical protein Q6364_06495 [Candidatus Hermodarchaeota archaeon]|nr:hypothetical protein [Candidatus Hermodarchaeota archaeon]
MAMRYSDLIKEYRRLVAIQPDQLISQEEPERVVNLYENDRIRILLLRTPEAPDTVKLEIEIALPDRIWGLDANYFSDAITTPDQPSICTSLQEMVLLFQYLLKLQKAGFTLDFYGEEGLFIACYYIDKTPSKTLYLAFQPPQIKAN